MEDLRFSQYARSATAAIEDAVYDLAFIIDLREHTTWEVCRTPSCQKQTCEQPLEAQRWGAIAQDSVEGQLR